MIEENHFLEVYEKLLSESAVFMNHHHDYFNAYTKAIQANFIAEKYLQDSGKAIESKVLVGIAFMDVNENEGHDLLENLYYNNLNFLRLNEKLYLWVNLALAKAKRVIGKSDEAIKILKDILEIVENKYQLNMDNVPFFYKEGVGACLFEITMCLIHNYGEEKNIAEFLLLEKELENKNNKDKELLLLERLKNNDYSLVDNGTNLQEAEYYASETLKFTSEYGINEIKLASMVNLGYFLIEQGKYLEALAIFNEIIDEEYIQKYLLGNLLNEIGLIKLKTSKIEEAKECLDNAREWLEAKNDARKLCRNYYIYALYHIKSDNFDEAYACAELGYKKSKNKDIYCLRLLYLISFYKFLSSKNKGENSDYVFYQYNLEQYKNKLKSKDRNVKI